MLKHLIIFRSDSLARSIGIVFSIVGVLFGTWATQIPHIKDKFGLDEAELGLFLLLLPLGAAAMNFLSVPLIHKIGTAKTTLLTLCGAALFLLIPSAASTLYLVAIGLFLFGMGFSAVNFSMNICASQFELDRKKSIISTCHGLWSGGAMIGAVAAGIGYSFGVNHAIYVACTALIAVLVGWLLKEELFALPDAQSASEVSTSTTRAFIRPNRSLWVLIIMGLCVNLGEGSMVDWSVVYAKEVLGTAEALASIGFAVYSFFMMLGRFFGDGLITRFGKKIVLHRCGLLMLSGYLLAVFAPSVWILFLGYILIGCGVSLGSPILYASAANAQGLPKGAGLAVYSTYAMIGFLGGPVIIGVLGKAYGLPTGFAMVAFFSLIWVLMTKRMS